MNRFSIANNNILFSTLLMLAPAVFGVMFYGSDSIVASSALGAGALGLAGSGSGIMKASFGTTWAEPARTSASRTRNAKTVPMPTPMRMRLFRICSMAVEYPFGWG